MKNYTNNIFVEKQQEWGGKWTLRKLDAFAKYVAAYLTIMKKHTYWETIYFDGFAGSGDRNKKCDSNLFKQLLLDEDVETYKGAAERVLKLPNNLSFDYYYFIDANNDSLIKLELKLHQIKPELASAIQYRSGDCNQYLLELANAMKNNPKRFASLVFIDPFGMQINWESISNLKDTRTDIWILVPTGVIVNRLLDRNGDLKHSVKLQSFFGLPEEEIRSYFYETKTYDTLFGETEVIRKVSEPIEKIAKLYVERLKTIWTHVTEKPLILPNSRNVPIYHFVFASNNKVAVNIAKQIISKRH